MMNGYKTYVAAAGLAGLGLYQLSQGDIQAGIQSIFGALGAFGLRSAIANQ